MNTKRLLIVWWLWYIWSHMVERAIRDWFDVTIIDNLSNSDSDVLRNIDEIFRTPWFEIDRNYKIRLIQKSFWDITEEDLYEDDYVACIDFAWFKAVWESCEDPFKYYKNNLSELITFLETLDKKWLKDFIFSSSATVYQWEWEYTEETPTWTTNPYWTTKLISEIILEDMVKFKWFNVISLRYFNPIWSHPSKLIWEYTEQPNNLLPVIAQVLCWKREKLIVHWWDYDTVDWTCNRDYIWINDLIDWHMKALEAFITWEVDLWENNLRKWDIPQFKILNLWTWRPLSVYEMISIVEDATWEEVKFEVWERRPWDKWRFFANSDLAKKEIWFEINDDFKTIIKDYIEFFKREYKKHNS